jgi:hypothetical protein
LRPIRIIIEIDPPHFVTPPRGRSGYGGFATLDGAGGGMAVDVEVVEVVIGGLPKSGLYPPPPSRRLII